MFVQPGNLLKALGAAFLITVLLLLVGMPAQPVVQAQQPAPAPGKYPVKAITNVAYHNGPDADPFKHRLDLYLPEGKMDAPVLFYVHGGAWTIGDKNHLGTSAKVGKTLASNGIALVSINYRLSPQVKHPEHIRDVARAFAWTRANIAKYGGCPEEIFVCGHSAGGHLVALLATDEQYLQEHSLSLKDIQGAIPVSGVYALTPAKIIEPVFGADPTIIKQASPITHARADAPPFLIIYADGDAPGCNKPYAQAFYQALKDKNNCADLFEAKDRNHMTVWFLAHSEADPVHQVVTSFMVSRVTLHRLAKHGPAGIDLLHHFLLGSLPEDNKK
jgi:acetyl esterase/lipase